MGRAFYHEKYKGHFDAVVDAASTYVYFPHPLVA
jgi:hypothetical protein